MLILWLVSGCTPETADPSKPSEPSQPETTEETTPTLACEPQSLPSSTLTLSAFGDLELVPGATREMSVLAIVHGGNIPTVDLCESWLVEPADVGVTIDEAGVLAVDPATPDGTEVVVTALLPDGAVPDQTGVTLSVGLIVYEPELRPWVGWWREESQIDCVTGEEYAPVLPLEEIRIKANGSMAVTWLPFELYVDWWAESSWDLSQGTVSLMPTGGNYVPTDIDGEGTSTLDGETLVLTDVWLGSPQDTTTPAGCGHRLY
jgi:hypothetical protein